MKYGKLKIEKVYWTTKEVSELTGVPDYTLRYWEKVVPYLQVPRNRAKNRAWRKQDIEFVKALKAMLMEENPNAISTQPPIDTASTQAPSADPHISSDSEESIPTIVSHEPLLEDEAKNRPIIPISKEPLESPLPQRRSSAEDKSLAEKSLEEPRKPDHEVLLKLRSELLLAMSKLRQ